VRVGGAIDLRWQRTVKDSGPVGSYVGRVPDASVEASWRTKLDRLYLEKRGRMWQAVFAFAGDPDVASDAVAEAFAQAWNRGEAIHSPERWLWRTIFRIAAGELKRRGRHVAERTEGSYEMDELAGDLVIALGKLPQKQRAAVVLHHAFGYPASEIADIIGSTTPAVYVHLNRARKRLRELLVTEDA
jgi:RNA polymerase sigma-70 factor, ECF subfamily